MKNWFIKICVEIPAPREFEYRVTGSSAAVAISRALRQFRKDMPRKVMREFKIRAILM